MWQYGGAKDPDRVMETELTEEAVLNLVRPLTKMSKADKFPIKTSCPTFDAAHPPTEVNSRCHLSSSASCFDVFIEFLSKFDPLSFQRLVVRRSFPPTPENGEEPEDEDSVDAVVESAAAPEEPAASSSTNEEEVAAEDFELRPRDSSTAEKTAPVAEKPKIAPPKKLGARGLALEVDSSEES